MVWHRHCAGHPDLRQPCEPVRPRTACGNRCFPAVDGRGGLSGFYVGLRIAVKRAADGSTPRSAGAVHRLGGLAVFEVQRDALDAGAICRRQPPRQAGITYSGSRSTSTHSKLDPRPDLDEWKSLLEEAGVREGRFHDARHTAATVLLLLGVSQRAVMAMMGWSNTSMAKRYQHVTEGLQRDIADQLNQFFWNPN